MHICTERKLSKRSCIFILCRALWFSCYGSEWDFALQIPQRTIARSSDPNRGPHCNDVSALVCLLSSRGSVCLWYSSTNGDVSNICFVYCIAGNFHEAEIFAVKHQFAKISSYKKFFLTNFLLTMSWGSWAYCRRAVDPVTQQRIDPPHRSKWWKFFFWNVIYHQLAFYYCNCKWVLKVSSLPLA